MDKDIQITSNNCQVSKLNHQTLAPTLTQDDQGHSAYKRDSGSPTPKPAKGVASGRLIPQEIPQMVD